MIELLASAAVSLVAPYLGKAADEAAKTLGKGVADAGIGLLSWMRTNLFGRAKEALDDAEKSPHNDNQADLRKQLTKLLSEHPEMVKELQDLLPKDAIESGGMGVKAGAGAKVVQVRGNNNASTIS